MACRLRIRPRAAWRSGRLWSVRCGGKQPLFCQARRSAVRLKMGRVRCPAGYCAAIDDRGSSRSPAQCSQWPMPRISVEHTRPALACEAAKGPPLRHCAVQCAVRVWHGNRRLRQNRAKDDPPHPQPGVHGQSRNCWRPRRGRGEGLPPAAPFRRRSARRQWRFRRSRCQRCRPDRRCTDPVPATRVQSRA